MGDLSTARARLLASWLDHGVERRTQALRVFFAGMVLLLAAVGALVVAEQQEICKTTTSHTTATHAGARSLAVSRDTTSAHTRRCEPPRWPKVPLLLGGLGLALVIPYLMSIVPPGSKVTLPGVHFDVGELRQDWESSNALEYAKMQRLREERNAS